MKYLCAYTLVVLSGKAQPTEDDVKKVLQEVGSDVNAQELTQTFNSLRGKQLHDLVAQGSKKLAQLSSGGGAAPSGGQATGAPAKAEAKAEVKKEVKEEKKEETDVGLGGGMFGDEEW